MHGSNMCSRLRRSVAEHSTQKHCKDSIFPENKKIFQCLFSTKAYHKRQMVAETALIAEPIESSEWFDTAIAFVFFQQEGSIVDKCMFYTAQQARRYEDMVDALPEPLITICGLCTMTPTGIARNMAQTVSCENLQRRAVGIIVEITCYNDMGIFGQLVHMCKQTVGHQFPACACMPSSSARSTRASSSLSIRWKGFRIMWLACLPSPTTSSKVPKVH